MRLRALAAIFLVVLISQVTASAGARPVVLFAAGDITDCSSNGAALTARLVEGHPGTVAAIGDTAYPTGSASDYERCYAPTWGTFRSRTRPVPGNHEYLTAGAGGYFDYFGARAAPPGGYYSYQLGSWHIIALNSECDRIGGCGPGSAELSWLRRDLAAHPARCTLAYWHRARFSEGPHALDDVAGEEAMQPIWETLVKAGADLALTGHDHMYERFAPLNAVGRVDPKRGLREFVVGTGGGPLYKVVTHAAGIQKVITFHWGVLRLELSAAGYSWQFLSTPHGAVLDSGSGSCH